MAVLQAAMNNEQAEQRWKKTERTLALSETLFMAEVAETDWGLPEEGMARFSGGIRRNMPTMIGTDSDGAFYSKMHGYNFQLNQIIAESAFKVHNEGDDEDDDSSLVDVEKRFDGTLTQNRYADLELKGGVFVECKAYALTGEPSDYELNQFFGQAWDYAQSGRTVHYRFKNGPPDWTQTVLYAVRQWAGTGILLIDRPLRLTFGGQMVRADPVIPTYKGRPDRSTDPLVAKLRQIHGDLLGFYPPPL